MEWANFFAKYVTIIVSALWILLTGTDFIDKQSAEIDLRNKALSKDSIARASGKIVDFIADNEPWIGEEELCTISGRYEIRNNGNLPVFIERVSYSVYEWPVFLSKHMKGKDIESRTLDKLIAESKPILKESISLPTKLNIEGVSSRSFQYIIRRKRGHLYAVVANAQGGMLGLNGKTHPNYRFSKNEVAADTGVRMLCGGDGTMPNKQKQAGA